MGSLLFLICFFLPLSGEESVISANGFERFCDYYVEERWDSLKPQLVKKGDRIYVNTSCLDRFFATLFPLIKEPFILISGMGFGTVDEKYLPFLQCARVIHWYGNHLTLKDPKATCLPLGGSWCFRRLLLGLEPYYEKLSADDYFKEKPFSIYVNWNEETDPSRGPILEYFKQLSGSKTSRRLPFKNYMEEMSQSRFVISPRGLNIDCFRTWEALYAGSIPVVESHGIDAVYEHLPVIIVERLEEVSEEQLNREFERLKAQTLHLDKLNIHYWFDKILTESGKG